MNFAVNVVASIVGGVVFWLGTTYLRPALHQLLWRGAQVAGSWDFYDNDPASDAKPVGKAQFEQRGGKIWGTAVRHTGRDGKKTHHEFRYAGNFGGREMVVTFFAPDRPDYIRGAIILHLNNHADAFSGNDKLLQRSRAYCRQPSNLVLQNDTLRTKVCGTCGPSTASLNLCPIAA